MIVGILHHRPVTGGLSVGEVGWIPESHASGFGGGSGTASRGQPYRVRRTMSNSVLGWSEFGISKSETTL